MSDNQFGKNFTFATFGESHGPTIGCVVDGVPPKIALEASTIQSYLDRRRPGQNRFVTQRREADKVEIISGIFEGLTTGTPIAMLIHNTDHRTKDYKDIATHYRPGHADFTYDKKYGHRDYRGGGRASARETAMRVAAGAIADIVLKSILSDKYEIYGSVVQIGPHKINRQNFDQSYIDKNAFFCADSQIISRWEDYLDSMRKSGSSAGAIIEIIAKNVPAGLGQPIYGKLDSELAAAMMSINAVKAVEVGSGFTLSACEGTQASDEMRSGDTSDEIVFLSNHNGGILGGISTGQDIIIRCAVKPTSSILTARRSVDKYGQNIDVSTKGRHDPCVGIRAVPVGEAMMAVVLLDQMMRHHAQTGL